MKTVQQEAVNYMHGPLLVLAGAGSGKTRVITHKVARLIQAGMPANRVAAGGVGASYRLPVRRRRAC